MKIIFFHKKFFQLSIFILFGVFAFSMQSCKQEKQTASANKEQQRIVVASIQSSASHLFYSGNIQPLHIYNLVSPVDGIVDELYFRPGDQVSANQLLLKIASSKSQQDYANALTSFIKDKDQYFQNKSKFEGTAALYKAGIVGKEDYLSQESQLGTSRLAYINSTNALKTIARKIPGAPQDIETLTLKDVTTIEAMLETQHGNFSINSPIAGIALTPESGPGSESGPPKILTEGSDVKQNQIIASIGDMTGISVNIHVGEIDINKIQLGQNAILSSPALPGLIFQGKVDSVARQAKSGESSASIANFPVAVAVAQITPEQRKLVKIGMSAKVELIINHAPEIKIPIKAVFFSEGSPHVKIIDPITAKPRDVKVETGATELDNIIILKGLNVGDKVIVSD